MLILCGRAEVNLKASHIPEELKAGWPRQKHPGGDLPTRRAWELLSVLGEGGGTRNECLCVEPQRPCEGFRMNVWDVLKAFKPLRVPREALRLEVIFFPLKLITILRVSELELMEMFKPLGVKFRHLFFASV